MKILTLSGTAELSGASRCMERVFARLVEAGHEVHAGVPAEGALLRALEAKGVTVHVVPGLQRLRSATDTTGVSWMQLLTGSPRSIRGLMRLIRATGAEVVHTNELMVPLPSVAAWLTRTPHVWHVRHRLELRTGGLLSAYLRWVGAGSRKVIAVTSFVKRQFAARDQDRVAVVYEGVDTAERQPDGAEMAAFRRRFPSGTQLVGVVGRIEWERRGQEMLVRAASLLQGRVEGVHFVFAGRSPAGSPQQELGLRELVKTYGLDDMVSFLGTEEAARTVLAGLDIVVVPPLLPQAFSMAALHAMAAGSCVVATRGGGLPELVEDGVTGVLFTPGDFSGLADALERLLGDAKMRERYGRAAREVVWQEFDFETTVRGLERALQGAAGAA